jgi:hypothetical protein
MVPMKSIHGTPVVTDNADVVIYTMSTLQSYRVLRSVIKKSFDTLRSAQPNIRVVLVHIVNVTSARGVATGVQRILSRMCPKTTEHTRHGTTTFFVADWMGDTMSSVFGNTTTHDICIMKDGHKMGYVHSKSRAAVRRCGCLMSRAALTRVVV